MDIEVDIELFAVVEWTYWLQSTVGVNCAIKLAGDGWNDIK